MKQQIKGHDLILLPCALVGAPLCRFDKVGAKTINHDSIEFLLQEVSKNQIIIMPTTNSAYGREEKTTFV